MHSLFALTEKSPALKSNENIPSLQKKLLATEKNISFARQSYNDSVTKYNLACESFPAGLVAGMFNFTRAEFFEV